MQRIMLKEDTHLLKLMVPWPEMSPGDPLLQPPPYFTDESTEAAEGKNTHSRSGGWFVLEAEKVSRFPDSQVKECFVCVTDKLAGWSF